MRRLGLAITTIALLAGTSAFAQTVTTVTGGGFNLLTNDNSEVGSGDGSASLHGAQANYSAFHDTTGNPIVFEASNSFARYQGVNSTLVAVDIGISNPEARTFNFQSTITAAGMGFYVGNTEVVSIPVPPGSPPFTQPTGCVQTANCVQSDLSFNDAAANYSTDPGFTYNGITNVVALSEFNFDVIGYTARDLDAQGNPLTGTGSVLYNRAGYALLRVDTASNVLSVGVVGTGVNGGIADLNGYTPIDNSASAFTFGWDATNFGFDVGGSITKLRYVSTVTTSTESACANLEFDLGNENEACIIAFAAFGDPIGRGGGVEALVDADFFALSLEDGGGLNLEAELGGITGINGERANFRRPQFVNGTLYFQDVNTAVPEPTTWAMMIMGFGALGAAMRRRRAFVRA